MGLITRETEVALNPKNIKHYQEKGYEILKSDNKILWGSKIKINTFDLLNGSNVKIDVKCDKCLKVLNIRWCAYKKFVHENDQYFCRECASKIFGTPKMKQTKLTNSKTIKDTYPDLIKYFNDIDDVYKYSNGSGEIIMSKCPNCNHKRPIKISDLKWYGFSCPKCGDNISYPEKFIFNLLEQLNVEFEIQKKFDWSQNKRYDFYIPSLNCIIETHGGQHYKETKSNWSTLQKVQENDQIKKQLTINNNIDNYIVLNCEQSNFEFIKNNIMCSELPKIFNFNESDIKWLKCEEYTASNLVKEVCYLWNNEIKSVLMIANKLKLSQVTIRKYLKRGTLLNWCNYDSIKQRRKQIICITTNEIFNSIKEAQKYYHTKNISSCCLGKLKSAGKHPDTEKSLQWMYYEDYLKLQNNNQIGN
jgi:predicted transcriptional regulator